MHDIRLIRDDPAAFDAALARRGVEAQAASLITIDEQVREAQKLSDELRFQQRQVGEQIGQYRAKLKSRRSDLEKVNDDRERHRFLNEIRSEENDLNKAERQATKLKKEHEEREKFRIELRPALEVLLSAIPNLPYPDVPDGADEADNVVEKTVGNPPAFDFAAKEHDTLGPALGMDFDTGVKLAGARFTLLRGPLAKLNRALGQFMLSTLADAHGYEQVVPPLLVRDEVAFGTGQLPKFAEDLFRTTDGRWLISTAEMSLTNIVREQILREDELPLRFCALTPCFRSEAGAAGRDTRGMIRQHQFDKVEMVSIVTPDTSEVEHERMTRAAEGLLEALALSYRRVKLCAGDMGFSAARTYDLEVWLPGQARYREISSCSTCTDFQARRIKAQYRPTGQDKKPWPFVHTLNGSGLAVGRTLVAVVENGQQADGSVVVPEVLRPYLGGLDLLEPKR